MAAHGYQNLDVWNKSMDLTVVVYDICKLLPKSELYALADQLKRAAVSVPSNIAEGQQRFSVKDTIHFSTVALGSLAELETQLILTKRLYGIDTDEALSSCNLIVRMLHALIKSLRQKDA